MELRRYFFMVRRHFLVVVLIVIVAVGTGYLTTSRTKVYDAQATLLIGQSAVRTDPATGQIQSDPIVAAQLAAVTYAKMIASPTTAGMAIARTGVARSPGEVANHTLAAQVTGTLLVTVDVRDRDSVVAAQLANGLAASFVDEIKQFVPATTGSPAATVYQQATVPSAPLANKLSRNLTIASVIGLVIAIGGAVLLEYLDVTIRGAADAERDIRLPVLAAVPLGSVDG